MTITSIGTLGSTSDTLAGTTIVHTTTAAAEAGHVVLLVVAKDNVQTTDGQTNEVTGITDSAGGNTWELIAEWCNGEAAANAGVVVSVWMSALTNQINNGGTITATMSSSTPNLAISAWEFSIGAGNKLVRAGSLALTSRDAVNTTSSMTVAPGISAEYLYFRGFAAENTISFTPASDFTAIETTSDNMSVAGEFIIETSTSKACTSSTITNARDQAHVYFALKEVPIGTAVFVDQGSYGVADAFVSASTLVFTATAPHAVGDVLVMVVTKDNVQTTDGVTNEVTGVTDSTGGNTWTKIGEYCNGQGSAAAGAVVALFIMQATVALAIGDSITATFSSSITAKSMSIQQFYATPGATLALEGSVQTSATDASSNPGSMSLSGLSNSLHLYLRAIAVEGSADISANTSGYSPIADNFSGGSTATRMGSHGELLIATSTGSTSAPTMSGTQDNASLFAAIKQTLPSTGENPLFFGAGL